MPGLKTSYIILLLILGTTNTIPLKAGQKVMLIQTPKGIYLRMGEKIIKIKLPLALLSSLTSSVDLEKIIPQMAIAENPTNIEDNQVLISR